MYSKKLMASVLAATMATPSISAVVAPKVLAEPAEKSNVIFILADDLGWMDVALNGSTYYETPNIQRLAAEGMTFTNAHSHPLCSPTRSAILTGQYPHRTGINAPAGHLPDNSSGFTFDPATAASWQKYVTKNTLNGLPTDLYTIGQAFKDNGYKTGLMGKHHLGIESKFQMVNRGFDVDLGMPVAGPGSYYNPYFSGKPGNIYDNGSLFKSGEDITDRLAREADKFITENKDTPFLLEMWDFSVHAPFQAKKEYVDYFQKKNVPDSPQNGNFHMAAMLKTMDDAVGKVLDSVERNGLTDKTMIVFMGDNGGNMYDSIDNHFPTNNYPLRQGKGTIYEGGIRVPCVVKVPNVTIAGSASNENIHAVDFYPTLLDYAGIATPTDKFSLNNQVLDGMSIMPLLSGTAQTLNRPGIFTNFIANVPAPGNTSSAAINSGKWKLIINYELLGGLKQKYELYDLDANISETVNLASQYPEKVAELEALINQHQIDIPQAMPKLNPAYNASAAIPTAYKVWDQWVKDFTLKVANDPNITGHYPNTVRSNKTTEFYQKIKNSLVMKVDNFATISKRYDDKIENNSTPMTISNITYVPLKYVAEKFGFSYMQTVDTATLTKNGVVTNLTESSATSNNQNVVLNNYPIISNNVFMLPLNAVQTILDKTATTDESGLIIIDDAPVLLTSEEVSLVNNYISSFSLFATSYWMAQNTPTIIQKAENEALYQILKTPPQYMGSAVKSWTFDTGTEGFILPQAEKGTLTHENGNLKLTVNTNDAFIYTPTISITASNSPILKLRYRNTSAASVMTVYWITSTDGAYGATKKTADIPIYSNMTDYETWYIDLSQYGTWSGTITQLRLDCIDNATSGSILYDSIEIMNKETPILSRWTFDSGSEGWVPVNKMTVDTSTPGLLACTVSGNDASLNFSGLNIPTDDYKLIKVRAKNATIATTMQVYFQTGTTNYGESNQNAITIEPNTTGFKDYYIDMSNIANWTGQIKSLRLDPVDNATSGTIYIDSIEVVKTKIENSIYFDGFDYALISDMASPIGVTPIKSWVEYQKVAALTSSITVGKKLSLVGTAAGAKVHYGKQMDATKLVNKEFIVSFDVKTSAQNLFTAYLGSNVGTARNLVPLVGLTKNATNNLNNLNVMGTIINDTANIWDVNKNLNIKIFVDNTGIKPIVSEIWIKDTATQIIKKFSQTGGYVFPTPTSTPDSDKLGEIRLCMENGTAGSSIILDNFAVLDMVAIAYTATYYKDSIETSSKTTANQVKLTLSDQTNLDIMPIVAVYDSSNKLINTVTGLKGQKEITVTGIDENSVIKLISLQSMENLKPLAPVQIISPSI